VVARAAEILEAEQQAFGRLMTLEMGKLVGAAAAEAAKCASACRYYAEHGAAFVRPEVVAGEDGVRFDPLGPVLAVMPWNFPFWQVIRFAAPALVAGNVGLLKHASNVPQCALALEDLFRRAGAPEGVFQTLLVGSERVEALIADDRVAAVTVTGSEAAGRAIGAAAGKHLKKSVLELGGSDPFLVLPSADLDRAVATAVKARIVNSGQSCIAAKRFIVADAIYDRFAPAFAAAMSALVVGDPADPRTQVGPLATAAIRDGVADQVARSVAAGAAVVTGGRVPDGPGWFYPPTVLADVPPSAPAAAEEVFGPVAPIFRVADIDEAIALANATPFGLGAAAFTRDRAEAERLARELEAGSVFINGLVASDPRFPFGGVKRSGHGRELARDGLREFVNVKTVRRADLPAA
ncbi:MAG TPA: NAD-dependent succinate-semialdehyde dehydrogenase, partial [Polyangia bacterium]|nr:NAD-dependent succinate-semialdehyde dehydrogenase [Polyangia bacterium]